MSRQFEQLENRRLMAADLVPIREVQFYPIFQPTPLTIGGTSGNDVISISNDGFGSINVNINGAPSTYSDWFVSNIIVNGFSGADSVYTSPSIGHRMEIHGGSGNDYLLGGDLNDVIDGGGDTDTIYGRYGDDQLDGGVPGFAYYWDNTGNDFINGGPGNDTLNASDVGSCTLDGSDGDDYLYGWQGNDNLYGGWGNDVAYGYTGNDNLYGYFGNDYLYGQDGNDNIRGQGDNDVVAGGNGDDVVHGDSGNDWVYGDAGNDKLYGDHGNDYLLGGVGDDTLVDIGGGQSDVLWGEAGFDSFWCDAEGTEIVADASFAETISGNVHRVGSFMTERFTNNSIWPWDWQYQTPGRDPNGNNFRDPDGGSNYANFSDRPLFNGSNPSPGDIDQGGLGDCYYLAPLSSVAKINPNRIKQSVVEMGDGTYAVRFYSGGSEVYLRVDGDLPRDGGGNLSFSGLGVGGAMWGPIMEKAWAHFRRNESSWQSTEYGWMDECYSALGVSTLSQNVDWGYKLFNNRDNLWQYVCDRLSEGRSVTVGTYGGATTLVGSHAYMVDSVYYSGTTKMVRLRNPWGNAGQPGAYVNITAQQMYDDISRVQSAYV